MFRPRGGCARRVLPFGWRASPALGARTSFLTAVAVLAAAAAVGAHGPDAAAAAASGTAARERPVFSTAAPARAASPVWFEPNLGQADPRVGVVARAGGLVALLTRDGAVLGGPGGRLGLRVVGAAGTVVPVGAAPGRSRYLRGSDPSRWLTDVPHHAEALLDEALPGVDVRWRGGDGPGGDLRFDVEFAPGADAAAFRMALDGADRAFVDDAGRLVADVRGARADVSAPVAWQVRGGRRESVAARWTQAADGTFGFDVAGRDPSAALVVDPTVSAGSFLGTSKVETGARAATDVSGALYLCGSTASASFPVSTGAAQETYGEPSTAGTYEVATDAFVAKFDADGTGLQWATYIGGEGNDAATGLVVEADGRVVVCGTTSADDFPTVNPILTTGPGFLLRLRADGTAIVVSTCIPDPPARMVSDGDRSLYVVVAASSIVTKYDVSLRVTRWSVGVTPATGTVTARGVAIDPTGKAWVVGYTNSQSTSLELFGAYDATWNGGASDMLLWSLEAADGARNYTSLVGGSGDDRAEDAVFDPHGMLVFCGTTTSANFPVAGAIQGTNRGGQDGFVAKFDVLNQAGTSQMTWSTYFGGAGTDAARALAVGPFDDVYVAGETTSTSSFPLANAIQGSNAGSTDAFVARIAPAGTLAWSTYLGGNGADTCGSVCIGPAGRPVVAGTTTSSSLPIASGSYATTHAGNGDAWTVAVEESTVPFGDVSPAVLALEPAEGVLYGTTLPLSGGHAPLTWALHSGALPPGLTLASTGGIGGTPPAGSAGVYAFVVRVRDADGATVLRRYSVKVWTPPRVTTTALTPWTIGREMFLPVQVADGKPPFQWRLHDQESPGGTGRLPQGTRVELTGEVSGVPEETGDFTFGVEVTDANGVARTGVVSLRVNDVPVVGAAVLADWTEGRPWTEEFTATAGTQPYVWSVSATGLPVSGAIDAATGVLSGTTLAAGDYAFTVSLTDAAGATDSEGFALHLNRTPTIVEDAMPAAFVERAYRARLHSAEGTGGRLWFTTGGGDFPVGLGLDGFEGVFGGHPLLVRDYEFEVKVVDDAGAAGTKYLPLEVLPFFSLASAKRNAVVDDFGEGGATGPVRRFVELLAGSRLDGTFRLLGRGKLGASLVLTDPDTGEPLDLSSRLRTRGARATLRDLTVDATRRFVVTTVPDEAFTGRVETKLRARARTVWKGAIDVDPAGVPVQATIAAKAGSFVTVTVKRAKKSAALPTIVGVLDARGNDLLVPDEVRTSKTGATLRMRTALEDSGDVTIVFAGSEDGEAGPCTWTARLRGSKGYDVRLYDLVAGDAADDE